MTGRARAVAFAAALAVTAAAAALAGAVIDPLREGDEPVGHDHATTAGGHADPTGGHAGPAAANGHGPAGLAVAEDGYALVPERTTFPRARTTTLAFRIVGPDGTPVRDLEVAHERRMHVIVVRRDLTGYQHLHPAHDGAGRWSVPLRLDEAGVYRVYADFSAAGRSRTLATDLHVAGSYAPAALPAAVAVDRLAGYEVRLEAAHPRAGGTAEIVYEIARGGRPLTDIEPYLGAEGHLVALREGDLAFLHVHPAGDAGRAGAIGFLAELPSVGRYRLFLQFAHDGAVRTVAHTLEVTR